MTEEEKTATLKVLDNAAFANLDEKTTKKQEEDGMLTQLKKDFAQLLGNAL